MHFGVFKMAHIREEYFMYGEERPRAQWILMHRKIEKLLEKMSATFTEPDEKPPLDIFINFHKKMGNLFDQLVKYDEGRTIAVSPELRERIAGQMMVSAYSQYLEGMKLQDLIKKKVQRQHDDFHLYNSAASGFLALLIVSFAVIMLRNITRPLSKLQKGTEIIAGGDLNYKTDIRTRDEIGQLSTAFDIMTESLKGITVSRDELNREVQFSQAVINSLPGLFYLFDEQGKFLRWNKNFEEDSGYSTEEIAHVSMLDLFGEPDKSFVEKAINQVFLTGEAVVEADLLSKNQTKTPFFFTGKRFMSEQKPCVVGMCIDISDRKHAEAALLKHSEDLKRSNEELQQFAYITSHDLQEPLRMITSYLQLIEKRYKGRLDKDADEFINFATDGAKRLQEMIVGILAYSRVETKGKPLEDVNCSEVLARAIINLQIAIEESRAFITTDSLPVVRGDAGQLVQLFQNLISNAIKFTRKDEIPVIHVSAKQIEEHAVSDTGAGFPGFISPIDLAPAEMKDKYLFNVKDNGIGIEAEYKDRIYNIFQRLHGREYPGVGIGLSLCRRIVERHGGRIWFESEIGKGTAFYFTIPIK